MIREFIRAHRILPSTRLAIQAAASALGAIIVVNSVSLDRPYWVILTAIVVMVGTAGETLAKSIDRTLGTLYGLIVGLALYWLAILVSFPATLLLVICAPSVVFFKFVSYRLMVAAVTASVVLLLELSGASQSLILSRLLDTSIGVVIAVAVSFLILRLPTRLPLRDTIDAYQQALADMVHDSLQAVAEGTWTEEIDTKAGLLRSSNTELERLAEALKDESSLIGGGDIAKSALAILPILREHVDTTAQAAQGAMAGGLGQIVATELHDIDRQIAANLEAVRNAIVTGKTGEIPKLYVYFKRIEAKLVPKLGETQEARDEIAGLLNFLLALRRLNRSMRTAMARPDG